MIKDDNEKSKMSGEKRKKRKKTTENNYVTNAGLGVAPSGAETCK